MLGQSAHVGKQYTSILGKQHPYVGFSFLLTGSHCEIETLLKMLLLAVTKLMLCIVKES